MGKRNHITFSVDQNAGDGKSSFLFMRTAMQTLGRDMYISVQSGQRAELYVKDAAVKRFRYRSEKEKESNVSKKERKAKEDRNEKEYSISKKEYIGRDFRILFISNNKLPSTSWAVGRQPVKCGGWEYQVGARGTFEAEITDHNAYIDFVCGEGKAGCFNVDTVNEHLMELVQRTVNDLVIRLFEEMGTLVVNADFLLDEIRLRFREFFIEGNKFKVPGVKIVAIEVKTLLIREEDLQSARDSFVNVQPAKPQPRKRTAAGSNSERTAGASRSRKNARATADTGE
ncbi:MAG: hypothetical protein IKB34_07395 [Clostridia bacterium]|nr:hypothetical protein [Clostridia bacterium]